MYGTYTLDRGYYNFTLQDVIIKDFTIKPGSEIVFNGDPTPPSSTSRPSTPSTPTFPTSTNLSCRTRT